MEKPSFIFIDLQSANKLHYVCDIVEFYYQKGSSITIYLKSEQDAQHLDRLLWIWKQDAFVPHSIEQTFNDVSEETVLITTNPSPPLASDALVLADPLPHDNVDKYAQIIDFAEGYDPEKLRLSRQRYKKIRDRGKFHLEYLKLGELMKKLS